MTDLIQLLEQAAQETNFTTNWSEHSLKFLAAFAKLVRNEALQEAKQVALDVYLNNVGDVTNGAKFYHADYVNPGWNLRRVKKIGDHIFYRG